MDIIVGYVIMSEYLNFIESVLKNLHKVTSSWENEVIRAWFHGFVAGDGSYTCSHTGRRDIHVETTHLGTLLCFTAIGIRLADTGYVRIYAYPRGNPKSFTTWKLRAYIQSHKEHELLCKKDIHEIFEDFSKRPDLLAAYTAGLMDSDGTVVLSVKKRFRPKPRFYLEPEVIIVNKDKKLLDLLYSRWIELNIHGNVQHHPGNLFRYRISAKSEICKFLVHVSKYMVNIERIGKATLLKAILQEKIHYDPVMIKTIVKRHLSYISRLKVIARQLAIEMYNQGISLIVTENEIKTVPRGEVYLYR